MADLTHMPHRIPDGQGHPAEADRRRKADVAEQRVQLAARRYVDHLVGGDEGAARRHLIALGHDAAAAVNPWRFAEVAVARALE